MLGPNPASHEVLCFWTISLILSYFHLCTYLRRDSTIPFSTQWVCMMPIISLSYFPCHGSLFTNSMYSSKNGGGFCLFVWVSHTWGMHHEAWALQWTRFLAFLGFLPFHLLQRHGLNLIFRWQVIHCWTKSGPYLSFPFEGGVWATFVSVQVLLLALYAQESLLDWPHTN